ncbi:MAG: substrate-binding domain-containing protein [Bacteroidota bacterium]|nr:substrate-binding domain-containing protein [Bacteroidota bacterium]
MKSFTIAFISFIILSCGHDASKSGQDTATYGTAKIASDESFQNLVDAELMVFHAQYTSADLKVIYKPEEEAFLDFFKDSVRLIVTSKRLAPADSESLVKSKIIPKTLKIATDGVALVVNNSNPDSMLTMKQLKQIFDGSITHWKDLGKRSLNEKIQIIFDNNNSSNLRFVRNAFELNTISSNIYVAGSNKKVVEYVSQNKNTIGVIGSNWISDTDDSTSKSFLKSVKVVAISSLDIPTSANDYYQPYQAYVATGDYPLSRNVYIISRETRTGLGTGFTAFCASEIGQRIILKMGLVPATAPVRIIKTKNKPLSEL